jgi:hypothetical protein
MSTISHLYKQFFVLDFELSTAQRRVNTTEQKLLQQQTMNKQFLLSRFLHSFAQAIPLTFLMSEEGKCQECANSTKQQQTCKNHILSAIIPTNAYLKKTMNMKSATISLPM